MREVGMAVREVGMVVREVGHSGEGGGAWQ